MDTSPAEGCVTLATSDKIISAIEYSYCISIAASPDRDMRIVPVSFT